MKVVAAAGLLGGLTVLRGASARALLLVLGYILYAVAMTLLTERGKLHQP